jgi:hypothetical protein
MWFWKRGLNGCLAFALWVGVWLRGKPWSLEQERELRALVGEGRGVDSIALAMGKTRVAVRAKMCHLGLCLKDATGVGGVVAAAPAAASSPASTLAPNSDATVNARTEVNGSGAVLDADVGAGGAVGVAVKEVKLVLPERLASVEDKLKVLDAALRELEKPGHSVQEVNWLRTIIYGVEIYQKLFTQYVDIKGFENEVLGLRRELAKERAKNAGQA